MVECLWENRVYRREEVIDDGYDDFIFGFIIIIIMIRICKVNNSRVIYELLFK